MTAPSAAADVPARIVATTEVAEAFFQTRLQVPRMTIMPGQFVQLRPRRRESSYPYLRIPLSVSAVDVGKQTIDVLYEQVGPKTSALRHLANGDEVGFLGPLGNHFSPPEPDVVPVLVGGGIGVPPLIYFGASLRADGKQPILLVGARSAGKHLPDDLLNPAAADVRRATDDGTLGTAGFVTDLLKVTLDELAQSPVVYTCGPHAMMAAVANLCAERDVPCFASLEEYMACGFGVCVGCVVERASNHDQPSPYGHYARVCVDGPIFDARQIVW
jgi:dihydroorotate dehydrogenase electron transfer subunit